MRADLEHLRRFVPRYDEGAGAARLADALAKAGAVAAVGGSAVTVAKTAASASWPLRLAIARWMALVCLPSAIVAGSLVTTAGLDARAPALARRSEAHLAGGDGREGAPSAFASPRLSPSASGFAPAAPEASARAARAAPRTRSPRTRAIGDDLREVGELKALLDHAPEEALRRVDRARYGSKSVLAEEREIIAIEALVATARRAEARRRARRFVAAHPESGYAARARAIAMEPE